MMWFKFNSLVIICRVKWVPVTTAWRVLRLRMEKRPPIRRVAVNKLNKQPRTRGGPPAWGLGEVLTTPSREKKPVWYYSQLDCFTLMRCFLWR
jgi:hypothetical protein